MQTAKALEAQSLECIECNEHVSAPLARAFFIGIEGVLCHRCAVGRGGQYDEAQHRWSAAPRIDDLLALTE
jgi:hypothetical protein